MKLVCLSTHWDSDVLDFRRRSWGVAVCFYTLFHPHISQLSLVVSFIHLTALLLLLSLRNPVFTTNQAYSRWSHLALSLWLQQAQLWPCSYLPSNISQTTSRQPCRQAGRDYCSASPSSHHKVFKYNPGESPEGIRIWREQDYREMSMRRQMPERCTRICLFFPPLLCPNQQIITFTHLQKAVQSPLAGLVAIVARESWFRHRPTSWQSNQDLSGSVGRVIFLGSLYLMFLLPKMLEFCFLTWWTLSVILCTDFGTSTDTRVQLFNCDPI